jgi:hypothetical protein
VLGLGRRDIKRLVAAQPVEHVFEVYHGPAIVELLLTISQHRCWPPGRDFRLRLHE